MSLRSIAARLKALEQQPTDEEEARRAADTYRAFLEAEGYTVPAGADLATLYQGLRDLIGLDDRPAKVDAPITVRRFVREQEASRDE